MTLLTYDSGSAIQASAFDHTTERVGIAMISKGVATSVVMTLSEMEAHIEECKRALQVCRDMEDAALNARIDSLDKPAAA